MKSTTLLLTFVAALSLLTACGSRTSSRNGFVLTPETRLALGTLKLEGTPEAVDKATAAKLLPLWQLLEQLSSSASAAPQEITAVVDQIQATMTSAQSQAISKMQFTQADFQAALQQARGSASSGGTRPGSTSGTAGANRGNGGGQAFFFGGAPGGGFPGGGFAGGGTRSSGGTGTATASSGGSSTSGTQSFANRSASFLVAEVVRLLQSKIGG